MSKNKLTMDDLLAKVVKEDYFVMGTTTFCQLTLQNGFTVSGKSACVDPANFNKELGEQIAKRRAIDEIWPLEGYLLQQKLWESNELIVDKQLCQTL